MGKVSSILAGYAFDGLVFHRARVSYRTNEVINAVTGQPIGVDPSLMFWYTRREFQNAIARLQQAGQLPTGTTLVSVTPTAELMADLSENGHLRGTRDHILHLLTAGRERILGRKFSEKEVAEFMLEADKMFAELAAPAQAVRKSA